MVRILAFFGESVDDELAEKIAEDSKRCDIIRLWCRAKFETEEGLTASYSALIDTGAYVSLIPKKIWSESKRTILTQHYVRGLIPKEECRMDVNVGEISCHLVDKQRMTKKYNFMGYFANTNDVPIILGFRELLSKFRICLDYQSNDAWLEEK